MSSDFAKLCFTTAVAVVEAAVGKTVAPLAFSAASLTLPSGDPDPALLSAMPVTL